MTTNNAIDSGNGTTGQVMQANTGAAPTYSTATYPSTTTINQILYSSSANTVAGLATANNGVVLTNGSGVPSVGTATVPVGGTGNTTFTAYSIICAGTTATGAFQNVVGVGTAGQVLVSGGASALPAWTTLPDATWVDQASSPVTMVANTSYISDLGSLLTFNVPATVAQGVVFEIAGKGAGGWIMQFNTGQVGHLNSSATSSAGSFASTNQWNCIKVLCVTANTTFVVLTSEGTITVA